MKSDGVLVVDKPAGMTSHDVVQEIRRILRMKKVGHTGTLDPDATGVLPVCIGEGTKISQFLLSSDKEYEATMVLGITTDTQDASGKILSRSEKLNFNEEEIEKVFSSFVGEFDQIPPMVSAVRHKGKKLYELARKGIDVERKPRRVKILELKILKIDLPRIHFRIVCSKGTYIRTLTKDIGEKLGCGAHQGKLRRLASGPFKLNEAVSLDKLKKESNPGSTIIPIEKALSYLQKIRLRDTLAEGLTKNAVVFDYDILESPQFENAEFIRLMDSSDMLIGVGKIETLSSGMIKRLKVLWVNLR